MGISPKWKTLAAKAASAPAGSPAVGSAPAPPAPPAAPAPAASPASGTYRPTPLNPPVTVRVGTVNSTSDAGIFIALEKGYFQEEVLIVETENFQTAVAMIAPLGAGQLDIATGALTPIAEHDPARFRPGGAAFLTRDEESSGIIDVSEILGEGWFLLAVQAHYRHPDPELVEGGQLVALWVPPMGP